MSETSDVTTSEKAAPIIKPSATSITLSRPRNAANGERFSDNHEKAPGKHTRKITVEP
jgi:hypothetical protein